MGNDETAIADMQGSNRETGTTIGLGHPMGCCTAAKGNGGFSSLGGPMFVPSALPQNRPWMNPPYEQGPPCSPGSAHPISSQESVTECPPMLKALPPDWSAPHKRPKLQQAVAALQDPNAGSPMQPSQEPMDNSGSAAAASEMPSERQERQATEGILMSGPESVQGTRDKDNNDYDEEDDSDEDDEDEEESEESPVAEAKSVKPSGGRPKGKGVS